MIIEKENQRSQNCKKNYGAHFFGHKSDNYCGLLAKRRENYLFILC
jgi:hypothetical protein